MMSQNHVFHLNPTNHTRFMQNEKFGNALFSKSHPTMMQFAQNMDTWTGTPLICNLQSTLDYNRNYPNGKVSIYGDGFYNNMYLENKMKQVNFLANTENSQDAMAHLIIHAHGIPLISNQSNRNGLRQNKNHSNNKWQNFNEKSKNPKMMYQNFSENNKPSGNGHKNSDFSYSFENIRKNVYDDVNKNCYKNQLFVNNKCGRGKNRNINNNRTSSKNSIFYETTVDFVDKNTSEALKHELVTNTQQDSNVNPKESVSVDENNAETQLPRIIKPRRRRKRDKKMSFESCTIPTNSSSRKPVISVKDEENFKKSDNWNNLGRNKFELELENFDNTCNSNSGTHFGTYNESSLALINSQLSETLHKHDSNKYTSAGLKSAYKISHVDKKSLPTTCCCCLCDPFCKIWAFPLHSSTYSDDARETTMQNDAVNELPETVSKCSCLPNDDDDSTTSTLTVTNNLPETDSSSFISHLFKFRNPEGISLEVVDKLDLPSHLFHNDDDDYVNQRNYVDGSSNSGNSISSSIDCMSMISSTDHNNNNININLFGRGEEICSDYDREIDISGVKCNSLGKNFPTAELLLSESINELSEKLMEVLDTRSDVQIHS